MEYRFATPPGAMKAKSTKTFDYRAVIARAESGALALKDVRAAIRTAEQFNNHDAVSRLREIEQRMQGERATARLSKNRAYGSAAWAFAQLAAVPNTPYSWAALDREGHVVVTLWDDEDGWARDDAGRWYPVHPYGARPDAARDAAQSRAGTATRTEFFRLLEVAVASHRGLVRAILCSAEDVHSRPRKRIPGSTRPWFNEDGSPVGLRITGLDVATHRFAYELVDESQRPCSPFRTVAPSRT